MHADELSSQRRSGLFVRGDDPLEVLERELGVNRHEVVADADDGVDRLTAAEAVLEGVVPAGQDVIEESFQHQFAEAAAEFGGAEDVLEAGDVTADGLDPLGAFGELTEALADVAENLGGFGDALADRLRDGVPLLPPAPLLLEAVPDEEDDQSGEEDDGDDLHIATIIHRDGKAGSPYVRSADTAHAAGEVVHCAEEGHQASPGIKLAHRGTSDRIKPVVASLKK